MATFDEALQKQREGAAKRVAESATERRAKIAVLREPGGLARADAPERIAARLDRLSRYYPEIRPLDPAAVASDETKAIADAGVVLERIIKTEDFLDVRYLEAGAAAARAVGRVNIRDDTGRVVGYGTGSLVSPQLLLTNHHVLPEAAVAAASDIEFNYQDGVDGRPLQPTVLGLDPERLFVADEGLDFALVAVRATSEDLAQFGYNRVIEAEGKAIVGDFVTIVQHPRGEKKQVALRENRIVNLLDLFLHYEADTEPGSSGSPVFNDQWEVVALHHASIRAPEGGELEFVNEGIRVSRLIKFIREQSFSHAGQALVDQLFADGSAFPAPSAPDQSPSDVPSPGSDLQTLRLNIPLEIRVGSGSAPIATPAPSAPVVEAITIDPDYASRKGYDTAFLGTGAHRVQLPELPEDLVPQAAVNSMATSEPRYLLPYHHFTVVQSKDRRLAFFTASNIDGSSSFRLKRERDRWFFDPRVPEEQQTGEEAYRNNPLDRGHLVRRIDPAWGPSRADAKAANDDTFHFTNCTPQHEDFNQNRTTWAGLEDYILENADNRDFKVSVFTGPVLASDDELFDGVQLPRQFWKVVAMVKESGALSATAYLLSQAELIGGLEVAPEEFSYAAYKTFQVPVARIQELTSLSFGSLVDADPLGAQEAMVPATEIRRPEQLVL